MQTDNWMTSEMTDGPTRRKPRKPTFTIIIHPSLVVSITNGCLYLFVPVKEIQLEIFDANIC
jgi:hypothetical protein